jgi:hypothetical protein
LSVRKGLITNEQFAEFMNHAWCLLHYNSLKEACMVISVFLKGQFFGCFFLGATKYGGKYWIIFLV